MTRRIAITGASGFIGRHLVRAVRKRGWRPVVLMRRHPGDLLDPEHELEIVLGDLADRASLERLVAGVDVIVHAAGAVKARGSGEYFEINALGTERLVAAATTFNPGARLLHVSSIAAREPTLSPYAASKRAGEEQVSRLGQGISWTIVRPPAVYGPGDLELLPFFRLARIGVLPVPATPAARFSLLHVSDLVEAILALAMSNSLGQATLEIDDGVEGGHDWPEIAAILQRLTGRKVRMVRMPRWAVEPVAVTAQILGWATRRAAMLSRAKLNEIYFPDWVARSADSPLSLDWHPKTEIWEGFSSTWDWYRKEGLLANGEDGLGMGRS